MKICSTVCGNSEDAEYDSYVTKISGRIAEGTVNGQKLFTTNASGLYAAYLNAFVDPADKQYHTCHTCEDFIEHYGGVVFIDADGTQRSALWNDSEVPLRYRESVLAMQKLACKANVTGVFCSKESFLGKPETGVWHHFYFKNPSPYQGLTKDASQYAAEKHEDFAMLNRALADFQIGLVEQALTLLKTDALYRSEKVLGVAQWLYNLQTSLLNVKDSRKKRNLVWLAVASAPAGFCHVRSSMIGTLLEDLASGMAFYEVERRFKAKMHPLQYQRPQAPPTDGNIARGEKIVEQLGIAKSLERRFARLEELPLIWKPESQELSQREGVFGHLKQQQSTPATVNTRIANITWEKFQRDILPDLVKIELVVLQHRAGFTAITTATHKDAPIIHQWGHPFCSYAYHGGSLPADFNITTQHATVTGICYNPSMWNNKNDHHGKSVIFVLEGAKDLRYEHSGNALFPETLKSELHEIRATIEAYSHIAVTSGFEDATACGLTISGESNEVFKVTFKTGQVAHYRIDRLE